MNNIVIFILVFHRKKFKTKLKFFKPAIKVDELKWIRIKDLFKVVLQSLYKFISIID